MSVMRAVSRRGFVGGVASAVGYLGLKPGAQLWAQGMSAARVAALQQEVEEYDAFAKLANNENPYGPSDAMMKAMTRAWKYANRYGYPDGDLVAKIAAHHGVSPTHIMLGAGSGEILDVVGITFLAGGRKVIGVEPSYSSVYRQATSIRSEAITLPLLEDHRQDIGALIEATKRNYRDVGFVYLCNPNNPTGRTVSTREVEQLLDGIPEDVPVLIDEAYHHFVQDPDYATSVPHVLAGRNVIVARTFSKIYGMAGMRLGYAIATPAMIRRMRPYSTGTINALVKWGGVAALEDTESADRVRRVTLELREKTARELTSMGYPVIPSETNFFMVHIRRPVGPVIDEFRKKGVLVGRPFPPMLDHLRVSIGTADEMARFTTAFRGIFTGSVSTGG
jgi:histidinol-phosphate aminotransferase